MTNIVNLNRFRKKKKRTEDEQRASENREKHGLTKIEKSKHRRDIEKLVSHVDAHQLDDKE